MFIGWLTYIPAVLLPHSPCRSTTANAPANRQMPIASVVSGYSKKTKKTKMNNNYRFIFLIFISIGLTSCFGLFDHGSDKIVGRYIVLWIDLQENQTISEQDEIDSPNSSTVIPEYVFAVGHNQDFIIAKQHPTNGFDGGYEVDTKTTNYYIVDVNRKILKTGKNVFGPLDINKFDSIRTVLRINEIDFDQIYPDKP
jgi:hypothetical protein